jgi:hypothetical protein
MNAVTRAKFRLRTRPCQGCRASGPGNGYSGAQVAAPSQRSQWADHPPGLSTTLLESSQAKRISTGFARSMIIRRDRLSPAVAEALPLRLLRAPLTCRSRAADSPF